MRNPTTIKSIESDPRVDCIERQPGMDSYSVMIYLADGYVAQDGTGTLYGRTVREASRGLATVTEGEPE